MKWSDITLDKWEKIVPYITPGGDTLPEDKIINIIANLYDMTEDEVLNLPLSKFQKYSASLSFLLEYPGVEVPDMKQVINGHKYNVVANFHKLTTAQYIDWDRNCNNHQDDPQLHRQALCILLIPEGKTYNTDYDMLDVWNDMGTLTMDRVLSLYAFFLILYKSYCRALLLYSKMKMRKTLGRKKSKPITQALGNLADMYGFPSSNQ